MEPSRWTVNRKLDRKADRYMTLMDGTGVDNSDNCGKHVCKEVDTRFLLLEAENSCDQLSTDFPVTSCTSLMKHEFLSEDSMDLATYSDGDSPEICVTLKFITYRD
jgi:hypothetical protein